jgi:hypothetical protein
MSQSLTHRRFKVSLNRFNLPSPFSGRRKRFLEELGVETKITVSRS